MADTQRTRAALQALFADNVTGQVSAQDLRDFLVTVMQPEFVNANDFWNEPLPDQITTSMTTRGYHLYSQNVGDVSLEFGRVYALTSDGVWSTAATDWISCNTVLGIAANSYDSNSTTAVILRRGIVYNSTAGFVDRLSGAGAKIGYPIYLLSLANASGSGAISVTNDDYSRVIGHVLPWTTGSTECRGKYYFCPDGWSITGT